jgi:WD40 repeat protein
MPRTTEPAMVFMTGDGVVTKRWKYPNNETTSIDVNVAGKYVGTHPNLKSIIVFAPGNDKTVPIYDLKTEKILCELTGHTAPVHNATYSIDGKRIVTGGQDNTVRVWDARTGKELNQISRRGFAATGFNGQIFLSNDKKTILTLGLGTAPTQIWDLETKRSINLTGVKFTGTPTISPNGTLIAGTGASISKKESFQEFVVFDTSNGKRVGSFKGNIGSMYMSFSADSKCIAIAMEDGVHVIDIATEQLKYKLPHIGVYHFAFSDDNSQVMTYSLIDGMSRLWNYETGEEIAGLVSFRADENTIVLPNRYYYSTKGAVKGIHYVLDNKTIPFDQFDLQYNRPDLVFEKLGVTDKKLLKGYQKAYIKRLTKNGITENMFSDEFHLPEVSIQKKQPSHNYHK